MGSLENLKTAARRWLKAIRANDPEARTRLTRAVPTAPADPVLRDVQHALAREHGHQDWLSLRRATEQADHTRTDLEQIDNLARDFLLAYRTGDAAALGRLGAEFNRKISWDALRLEVQRRVRFLPRAERPDRDLALSDVQLFLARAAGCDTWTELVETLTRDYTVGPRTGKPAVTIPALREDPQSGMLHPLELRIELPMELPDGVYSTTTDVWRMLVAGRTGDLDAARELISATPDLVRAEYNYMPPLHLAVREGHMEFVRFVVDQGAYNPLYKTYPYGETLLTMAGDRGADAIAALLVEAAERPRRAEGQPGGVHGVGHIEFPVDDDRTRLEKLVGANALQGIEALLARRPDLAQDNLAFYAEGILAQAVNRNQRAVMDLLMARGARVPDIAKWGRFYYFKHAEVAAVLLERGMNPNHMTWHRTTLLHDMAGEGNAEKAGLLLKHGAELNPVDDEFRSTPLGFAARWGRRNIVRLLLDHGADPNVAGADWATPLAWAEKKGHRDIARDLRAVGAR